MTDHALPACVRPALEGLVELVVAGDVGALRSAAGVVVRGEDPLLWVREYPGTLTPLLAQAWNHLSCGRLAEGTRWWVCIDLWTVEEGRSDLTLEATVWLGADGPVVELDGIHVL